MLWGLWNDGVAICKSLISFIPSQFSLTFINFRSNHVNWKHSRASRECPEGTWRAWTMHHSVQSLLHTSCRSNGHSTLSRHEDLDIGTQRRRAKSFWSEIFRHWLNLSFNSSIFYVFVSKIMWNNIPWMRKVWKNKSQKLFWI